MIKYLSGAGAVLISPVRAFADTFDRGYWYGWGHMGGPGWGGMFMWILFLIIAVLLVYVILRGMKGDRSGTSFHETPLDILKKRYARGEITREQFDEIKNDLK